MDADGGLKGGMLLSGLEGRLLKESEDWQQDYSVKIALRNFFALADVGVTGDDVEGCFLGWSKFGGVGFVG